MKGEVSVLRRGRDFKALKDRRWKAESDAGKKVGGQRVLQSKNLLWRKGTFISNRQKKSALSVSYAYFSPLSAISAAAYGLIGKERKIGKKTEVSVFIKSYDF